MKLFPVVVVLMLVAPPLAEAQAAKEHRPQYRHDGCNTRKCDRRMDRKEHAKTVHRKWVVVRPFNWKLERMAGCESGHRWHIATGNGFYGGLQFTLSTWRSVGGRGMPHWASELEQKFRAVILIKAAGYGPWPICGFV
jgi:hypothetical protein